MDDDPDMDQERNEWIMSYKQVACKQAVAKVSLRLAHKLDMGQQSTCRGWKMQDKGELKREV